MTLDEAIFVLEKMKNTHGIVPAYEVNALSIAIRSLEAWELVKLDIEKYRIDCDESCYGCENCLSCNQRTFGGIERIIEKRLKELENDS